MRNLADVRVGQLAPHVRDMVRLLAALGRPAGFELLQLLSKDASDELLAALHSAVDAAILTVEAETSSYRFRHALLAEAVLGQLLPGERPAVHANIAAALAQRPELSTGPGELGYHQSAAGDLPGAVGSYMAAASDAERVYAFGEAGGHLERVLELWAQVPDAAERAGRSRGDVLVAGTWVVLETSTAPLRTRPLPSATPRSPATPSVEPSCGSKSRGTTCRTATAVGVCGLGSGRDATRFGA